MGLILDIIRKIRVTRIEAVQRAHKRIAQAVMEHSLVYVPVDSGALKSTARVREEGSGTDHEVTVAYGDKDIGLIAGVSSKTGQKVLRNPSDYAASVHTYRPTDRHTSPESDEFLSKAVYEVLEDEAKVILMEEVLK